MPSKINYGVDNLESWNPIKVKMPDGKLKGWHCSKCSPGCDNCWAEGMNRRSGNGLPYLPNSKVGFAIDEKVLAKPLSWKKPRTIFVCNMCDLFHESMGFAVIDQAFKSIIPRHRYLILTKRPKEMELYFRYPADLGPPDNVWLGVTVCNQAEADEKIPILLSIPAAHRWVSIEPMLEDIKLFEWNRDEGCLEGCAVIKHGGTTTSTPDGPSEGYDDSYAGIDWVVVGCESGSGRRPMDWEWAEGIIEQCQTAGVPCYIKQLEINDLVNKNMMDWPKEVRVRQAPW